MSKRKVCIITKSMHSINTIIEFVQMSQEYIVSAIVLISKHIKTYHEYFSIHVFPIDEMEKCIEKCDAILISETIVGDDEMLQKRIIECAQKHSIMICNNVIADKIHNLDIKKEICDYKPIAIPVFVITTMRPNIGEERLFLKLTKQINALGENVLGISNGFSSAFYKNIYPFPIISLNNIAKGEERIIYLNTYLQKAVSKTNSTIIIFLVDGSCCNPYLLPNFEVPYKLNLIESACEVDYHINIVPLNFISRHSLSNNNSRVNNISKKHIDINIISNVLFDVPNEDVYQTFRDIPIVTIAPKNANKNIKLLDNTNDLLIGSLCDDNISQTIVNNIIKKLKKKTSYYEAL